MIYTAQQAAAALGCSLRTLKHYARILGCGKHGPAWAISEADLACIRAAIQATRERIYSPQMQASKSANRWAKKKIGKISE